jgi:chromosome segregation ATPase
VPKGVDIRITANADDAKKGFGTAADAAEKLRLSMDKVAIQIERQKLQHAALGAQIAKTDDKTGLLKNRMKMLEQNMREGEAKIRSSTAALKRPWRSGPRLWWSPTPVSALSSPSLPAS